MKYFLLVFSLLQLNHMMAQCNTENITIYRDSYGVPHIQAKTDREASYGLAWAHSEDDFMTIQNTFLPSKRLMGMYSGKEGVIMDYLVALLRCREIAKEHYSDLSPEVLEVISGYVEGINAYAKSHPDEVLVKNSFPMTVMDYLTGYNLVIHFFSDTGNILREILSNQIKTVEESSSEMHKNTIGSNAFAFSRKIMKHDKTVLNVNTHQPLEGPFSWYEAHVVSDEGWNMLGGLFPGSPFPLIGTNEQLGWTHTYNYPDLIDVYQLEINPKNKNQYLLDGKWVEFEKSSVKLRMKTKLGIKLKVKRKLLWSVFGPVLKNKKGHFAFYSNALENISSIDQWYHMGKATSWSEFEAALKMMAIPRFNVMYADRKDSIFFMSIARIQKRPKGGAIHNDIMMGDNSDVISLGFHDYEDLPKLMNPGHGYLFNTNNSPYNCAHSEDNPDEKEHESFQFGFREKENNRSSRFMSLLENKAQLSMNDFFDIKYDIQYPEDIWTPSGASAIFDLDDLTYPEYSNLIHYIKNWNHRADTFNVGAAQWAIYYGNYLNLKNKGYDNGVHIKKALKKTQKHLLKYYGRIDIELRDYQRHQRGTKELAVPGLKDMIAAMTSVPYKKGRAKPVHGESYIMIAQYDDDGVEIESVLPYVNSRRADGPHYTDQMEMYARQERKKMTLNMEEIIEKALKSYHPK